MVSGDRICERSDDRNGERMGNGDTPSGDGEESLMEGSVTYRSGKEIWKHLEHLAAVGEYFGSTTTENMPNSNSNEY